MALLAGTALASAQNLSISGTITDENNQPLAGANVLVKNTSNGAQTDFDGNFSISAATDAILVISYMGFVTQEIPVNGKTTINAILIEDASQLDEVVIVGYGKQKKSDLTGAVAQVGSKEIEKYTYSDATQALQGRMAGVNVSQQGGAPGANSVTVTDPPFAPPSVKAVVSAGLKPECLCTIFPVRGNFHTAAHFCIRGDGIAGLVVERIFNTFNK